LIAAWSLRRKEERLLEKTEKLMLWWILGVSLWNMKRIEDIRREVGVAIIIDKVHEVRLRWYGHVEWREENNSAK